jgi:hypothetical protein
MTAAQMRTFREAVQARRERGHQPINDVTMPLYHAERDASMALNAAWVIRAQVPRCASAFYRVHNAVNRWAGVL